MEEEELEVTVGMCEVETIVPRTRGKSKNEKEKEGREKGEICEYISVRPTRCNKW